MSRKLLLRTGAGLFFLLLVALTLPFTPIGNSLLKPYVQKKINETSPIPLELTQFRLGFSSFNLLFQGGESLTANLKGNYSLLSQSVDALFDLKVNDLSYASSLASVPLQGAFTLSAKASGNREKLSIIGESDIAQGETKFLIELRSFALYSAIANVKKARLETLLATLGKPSYAKAALYLDLKLESAPEGGFKGEVELLANDGEASKEVMKQEFDIAIPSTLFNLKLASHFNGDNVAHNLKFASNIGNINTSGATNLKTLATDSLYALDLSDLSPLTPLAGVPLRGKLKAQGTLKGDKKSLLLDGSTDLAGSQSSYLITLQDLAPATADISVSNLKLERLLFMLGKPQYVTGNLNLNASLKDFKEGISGELKMEVPSAITSKEPIERDFNLSMPATKLSLASSVLLHQGKGNAKIHLDSDLLKFVAPKVQVVTLPALMIEAPYELLIPDLSKLAFLTKQKLKGDLKATGKIQHSPQSLIADFFSQTLGGEVSGKLQNDDLSLKLSQVEFLELLKMLDYPALFSSKTDGSFLYNLTKGEGILEAQAQKGRFLENQLSLLLRPLFGIDLTKEVYNHATLKSKINKGVILSDLAMKSQNTELHSQNALIDTDRNKIDAKLEAKFKDRPATLTLEGALDKPKISIDTHGLLQDKAGKAVEKYVPEKVKEPVKNLIKGLF